MHSDDVTVPPGGSTGDIWTMKPAVDREATISIAAIDLDIGGEEAVLVDLDGGPTEEDETACGQYHAAWVTPAELRRLADAAERAIANARRVARHRRTDGPQCRHCVRKLGDDHRETCAVVHGAILDGHIARGSRLLVGADHCDEASPDAAEAGR